MVWRLLVGCLWPLLLLAWTAHSLMSVHGPYYIENMADCNVLDVRPPVNVLGAKVITSLQVNTSCQMWDIYDVGTGYMIINRHNGMALDIEDGGIRSGADVITWGATFACNQRWTFAADGTIRSGRKDLVLDVLAPVFGHSAQVIAYPRHGGRNQIFRVKAAGEFVPRQPNVV